MRPAGCEKFPARIRQFASDSLKQLRHIYRCARVLLKQALLIEPVVLRKLHRRLEFHGNDYCGWCIPAGVLNAGSVVVDVGLGEDVSFSQSLVEQYGCVVHGFDPTPRAIEYVRSLGCERLKLHESAVASRSQIASFFLPNDASHVSGSLLLEEHLGRQEMQISVVGIRELFALIGAERINLLKLDVEGAEYDLIASAEFADCAARIDMICIEFHHRWRRFGRRATSNAVSVLNGLGFQCAWRGLATNEEFLFLRP